MESSDQARLAGNDTGALAGVGGIAVAGAAPLGVGQFIFLGVVGEAGTAPLALTHPD